MAKVTQQDQKKGKHQTQFPSSQAQFVASPHLSEGVKLGSRIRPLFSETLLSLPGNLIFQDVTECEMWADRCSGFLGVA